MTAPLSKPSAVFYCWCSSWSAPTPPQHQYQQQQQQQRQEEDRKMVAAHTSSHSSESSEWIICLDKRPAERSGEDVDIIQARLKNVKAFERFHPSLLQRICLCGFYECLEKGITCESKHKL
ncbi:Rap guanine nucleotide exchange factor 4 [Larimichthys crocea]|uniref:Uncharacterized protein n=1 Tax=Larimichthys crocea TaxID=215358 RepID=A0ACD3QGD9_LARCR|nr:Rap guanine nucleotide exchange factor 4 [Larimichthys crocea]